MLWPSGYLIKLFGPFPPLDIDLVDRLTLISSKLTERAYVATLIAPAKI